MAAGTPELELFKQQYFSEVRCRLGTLGAPLGYNLTWSGSSQLACHFEEPLHAQQSQHSSHPNYHHCVEVSINAGRLYSSACSKVLGSTRAPIVKDFEPKLSLIADPTTIVLSGVGFAQASRYWCLFAGPGTVEALQEATYRSEGEIECQKPLATTTLESHDLELSLFFSAAWPANGGQQAAPLLAKRFVEPHKNWAYVSL